MTPGTREGDGCEEPSSKISLRSQPVKEPGTTGSDGGAACVWSTWEADQVERCRPSGHLAPHGHSREPRGRGLPAQLLQHIT